MNEEQHFLLKLSEECLEVAKCCSKASLFGLDETNVLRPDGPNNTEKLIDELNDLMGVISILETEGILPEGWMNEDKVNKKRSKVFRFLGYSKDLGRTK